MILFWVKRIVLLVLMLFFGFWAFIGILLVLIAFANWQSGAPIVLGLGAVILALSGVVLKKSWDFWKILSLARRQVNQAAVDEPAGEAGKTDAPEAAGGDEQDPDQVPVPKGAELSYLDVQALDFWNGRKTSFEVPQYYMRTPFGKNVKEALPRLLDGGYLEQGDLEQRVSLKKVPELKAILSEHQLKVSGTKKELVHRVLDHFDPKDLEEMFPENVYHISEKGRQAMEPYSIIRDNDAHALGLSYYRLMQAKEAQPDEENNVILTQLLSEDIQKCYQEQNRAEYQRVIGTTGRFMQEVGEYELSFECYALAFFVWVNGQADNPFATDSQLYYMAKNVEQAGKLCGYSFDQLCEAFEKAIQKSNPFALDTEENRSAALSQLKEALGL